MKIKGLLMGMAAFMGFALFSCSDDAIDVNNQEVQVDNTPAYLTVTFSANSASSRSTADDANNAGDIHGTAEDSKHHNIGTEGENVVNNALVVIQSTTPGVGGYAALYEKFETDKGENSSYGIGALTQYGAPDAGTFYTAGNPIELTSNTFEVLVVANPVEELYSAYQAELKNGTRNTKTIEALYIAITTGDYKVEDTTPYNYAGEIVSFTTSDETTNVTGIMMANKDLKTVKLAPETTETADVTIERVASKITFRPTLVSGQQEYNVYPIEVPDPSTIQNVVVDYEGKKLNKARYPGQEGFVYIEFDASNNFVSMWKEGANATYEKIVLAGDFKFDPAKARYEAKYGTLKWNVKLTDYALVNLSKSVYHVRHVIEGEDGKAKADETAKAFKVLNGSNFLYTPNWEKEIMGWTINDVTFKGGKFDKEGFTTNDWFFNTLQDVSDESAGLTTPDPTYFAALPTGTIEGTGAVDGDIHYKGTTNPEIGHLLAYCLENSTDVLHQTYGLSTGITFKAHIYDENMLPITAMYRYKGYVFESIAKMQKAFPDDSNLDNLTDDATVLEKAGVVKYDSNICYYYTTEIKHYDNGVSAEEELKEGQTTSLGNMEFAIMRNNIYSLSVTGINVIGDPYVAPIPGTPDEAAEPKLEVKATILPWIVRYHDIEFN